MDEISEIVGTIEDVQEIQDDLLVRGLRAVPPSSLARLRGMQERLVQIGAAHMAERLQQLVTAIENDDRLAARALLHAQTSLRLLERVLSREVALAALETLQQIATAEEETACGDVAENESA